MRRLNDHRLQAVVIQSNVPSERTLERTPARALQFLAGVGKKPQIAAILSLRGYNKAVHKTGWDLLQLAAAYEEPAIVNVGTTPEEVRVATMLLDAWDEPNFRITRAALARDFPNQLGYLFDELKAGTGAESILAVSTFVSRYDALANGTKEREATREQDRAAMERLAERGIDAAEIEKLKGWLTTAQDLITTEVSSEAAAQAEARQREALISLSYWYSEWSEIARALIKRRSHLISLGLAHRRSRTSSRDEEHEDEAPPDVDAQPRDDGEPDWHRNAHGDQPE